MKIYLIKSASHLFKYNKTIRFNVFNKNIIFYNYFCTNNINNNKQDSINDIKSNVQDSNEYNNKNNSLINKNDHEFDLELQNTNIDNLHKNIQLRLYQKESENEIIEKSENSLIEKKDNLPVNNKESELTRVENLILLKNQLDAEDKILKKENYQKSKIGVSLFILLVGLFSLWIPLYKTICESQGFSVKTTHTDYKFKDRKCIIFIRNLTNFY